MLSQSLSGQLKWKRWENKNQKGFPEKTNEFLTHVIGLVFGRREGRLFRLLAFDALVGLSSIFT